MREIKFRGIPKNKYHNDIKNILDTVEFYSKGRDYDGVFIYGYLNGEYILGPGSYITDECYDPSYWVKVDKVTIGQYTGLKDKNGKEIYEGDILQWKEGGEYYSGYWVVYDHAEFKLWNGRYHKTIIDSTWYEVIGDIYKNPELLEEG